MNYQFFLLFFGALLWLSDGKSLPRQLNVCFRTNADINECLKNAVQSALTLLANGLPEFHVPPLQPITIPTLTIGEGTTGTVNVEQQYKNFKLYNIPTCKLSSFSSNVQPNSLEINLECIAEEPRFEADYTLNGQLLLLPITGKGKCTVRFQKIHNNFTLVAETFEKKMKKYLKVKHLDLKLTPENVHFDFENLFNGDKALGSEINKVLNGNWKEVYNDIGRKYEAVLEKVFSDIIDKIFSNVPYNELLPVR